MPGIAAARSQTQQRTGKRARKAGKQRAKHAHKPAHVYVVLAKDSLLAWTARAEFTLSSMERKVTGTRAEDRRLLLLLLRLLSSSCVLQSAAAPLVGAFCWKVGSPRMAAMS